jgi:XisI protein
MDTFVPVENIKIIIKNLLLEYVEFFGKQPNLEIESVFDDEKGHYELIQMGWIGLKRVHGIYMHVDIKDNKIWIQHDGTNIGIATEFMEHGIPAGQIVLGFRSPAERKNSIFALS